MNGSNNTANEEQQAPSKILQTASAGQLVDKYSNASAIIRLARMKLKLDQSTISCRGALLGLKFSTTENDNNSLLEILSCFTFDGLNRSILSTAASSASLGNGLNQRCHWHSSSTVDKSNERHAISFSDITARRPATILLSSSRRAMW